MRRTPFLAAMAVICLTVPMAAGCLVNIPSVRGDGQNPWEWSGRYSDTEETCGGEPDPEAPSPDEIPWPKYHPVPTRPVFSRP